MRRFLIFPAAFLCAAAGALPPEAELRFCLHGDPKTFDPFRAEDENSETVRYLTTGVLARLDRVTEKLSPELAVSWRVDQQGRRITFQLRRGVSFSDGSQFTSADVAFSLARLFDPQLHSPVAEAFNLTAPPQIAAPSADSVSVTFPRAIAGVERLFDQVSIVSSRAAGAAAPTLGPFLVESYRPGVEVALARNPRYYKVDAQGRRLPYANRVRLLIQTNREMEALRFTRGEIDLVGALDPAVFDDLQRRGAGRPLDAGPSLDSEMMWFNQAARAPLAAHKREWFQSQAFRRAVSESIRRDDLCRVVYKGHARPAAGPVSPANRLWCNTALKPHPYDAAAALRRLSADGFRMQGGVLADRAGRPVEFSIVTNAGNQSRERIAAMIQQDLKAIGIRVSVTTLDFPSLIERITRSLDYEACLLGLTNMDLDPNGQMNVWLSSAANHQWNPSQSSPATAWEAEIDRLMRAQAAELRPGERKRLFDRVQQIVWEQAPFLYLVNKNSLMAFATELRNAAPAVLHPSTFWNIEFLDKRAPALGSVR